MMKPFAEAQTAMDTWLDGWRMAIRKGIDTMKKVVALLLILCCLGTAAMAEVYVKAIASPTWVRTSPNLGNNIVDKLAPGSYYEWGGNVSYDSRGIAWYDVWYSGGYGWISSLHGNLVDTDTGATHNDSSIALGNGTAIRANADVNVRTGPGTYYSSIGTLYKGSTADYTGTKKYDGSGRLWYQINYYNNIGWVSSRYTSIY